MRLDISGRIARLFIYCQIFIGQKEGTILRKQKDGTERHPCPVPMNDYSSNMFSADRADQLCAIYGTSYISKKSGGKGYFLAC